MSDKKIIVPTMAEMLAKGETPDILFWVGCSGSFDDRAKKIVDGWPRYGELVSYVLDCGSLPIKIVNL